MATDKKDDKLDVSISLSKEVVSQLEKEMKKHRRSDKSQYIENFLRKTYKPSKKTKVTVTLDQSLVNLIDREVDKRKYSSRSNAIEILLSSFIPKIESSLFLISKTKVEFDLKFELPIIVNELKNLLRQGITKIIISYNEANDEFYGKLRAKIQELNQQYTNSNIIIDYSHVYHGNGTSITNMFNSSRMSTNPLMIIHGTVLRGLEHNKINYQSIYNYHKNNNGELTMVLGDLSFYDPTLKAPGGELPNEYEKLKTQSHVLMQGERVNAIQKFDGNTNPDDLTGLEKKIFNSSLVDLGIYVLDPSIIPIIESQIKNHPEHYASFTQRHTDHSERPSIIEKLIRDGHRVLGYPFSGYWNHFRRLGPG